MTAPGYSAMLRAMARRSVVFRRCVDRTAEIGCQVISERSVAAREVERLRAALAGLIAVEDEPHPHGHTTDECIAWQEDYRRRDTAAWERARASVAGQGDTPPAEPLCHNCDQTIERCTAYAPDFGFTCAIPARAHLGPHFDLSGGHWDANGQIDPPAEPMIPFDPDRVADDYQPIPRSEVPPLAGRDGQVRPVIGSVAWESALPMAPTGLAAQLNTVWIEATKLDPSEQAFLVWHNAEAMKANGMPHPEGGTS